jgi:hypothetical protein
VVGPLAVQIEEIAVASSGSTFSKMQREREKKERAAAKREARQNKSTGEATETSTVIGEGDLSAGDLVRLVEAIHKEYEDGTIDLDEFEEKKQALLARVKID